MLIDSNISQLVQVIRLALPTLYFVPPVVSRMFVSWKVITAVLTIYPTSKGSAASSEVSTSITNGTVEAAGAWDTPVGFTRASASSTKSVCMYEESRATRFHLKLELTAKTVGEARSVLMGMYTSIGLSKDT